MVIVHQNAIQPIINLIQISRFAKTNSRHVMFVFIKYSWITKDNSQNFDNTNLLFIQDGKKTYIKPDILYYYGQISICFITNKNR